LGAPVILHLGCAQLPLTFLGAPVSIGRPGEARRVKRLSASPRPRSCDRHLLHTVWILSMGAWGDRGERERFIRTFDGGSRRRPRTNSASTYLQVCLTR
jgi:hypothetical protein